MRRADGRVAGLGIGMTGERGGSVCVFGVWVLIVWGILWGMMVSGGICGTTVIFIMQGDDAAFLFGFMSDM